VRQPAACSTGLRDSVRSGGERSPRPGSPSRTRVLPSTRPLGGRGRAAAASPRRALDRPARLRALRGRAESATC